MSDSDPMGSIERDERVIAVAQQIVKALGTSKNPTEDMIKFLSDFDLELSKSRIPDFLGKKVDTREIEEKLDLLQGKVTSWDTTMIWGCDSEEATECLKDVDEVQRLADRLGNLSMKDGHRKENNELLQRAHSILQMAMARLEEEFNNILIQNKQLLEPEHLSFRSSEDEFVYDESFSSAEYDRLVESQAKLQRDGSKGPEDYVIDLVSPDCIFDLKRIAEVMFNSKYDQECCQAYVTIRKDALDECLFILEVEKLSIEEVLKMDWSNLNHMIMRWNRAAKIFVRVYLASEKRLCDLIFRELGQASQTCFTETSKGSILQLLNFAEAVAMGPHLPERIFRVLDMYEVLVDLIPDIDSFFPEEAGSHVRMECHDVLRGLGDSVKVTFMEFENAVRTNTSTNPFAGGGVHHLTKYVMNYLRALTEYSETLNLLLENSCEEDRTSPSSTPDLVQEDYAEGRSFHSVSPMSCRLSSVTNVLESNLDGKSKLYKDNALQHFFLMNNVYYMVQKIKNSDLAGLFGDDWIRRHNRKFQQHAVIYERASWNHILSYLKDDRSSNAGSNSTSKTVLKDKFKNFNFAFEEIYKTQTAWLIPDPQLRDDLRISISLKVLQAYRTFTGRYAHQLDDRYIKYSEEDLQNYLLDFFEGSPRSLQNQRWR